MSVYGGPKISENGLILCLDAANPKSYSGSGTTWFDVSGNGNHFTLFNSPTFSSNRLIFNGTNQYARSVNNIDFTLTSSITVQIFSRTTATTGGMMFEHTANWNTNTGGFGLAPHSNGNLGRVNLQHTNHNTVAARNYEFNIGTNWAHHTNIFSRISDSTGRLVYTNAQLTPFSAEGGYPTGTATGAGSFANSLMYIASRGGTGSYCPLELGVFMIFNRKLSDNEISQNFNAIKGRFGI
jgi:hypothetical protein